MLKENEQFEFFESQEREISERGVGPELSDRSREIHENAIHRAKKYLVAEAELLDAIMKVDEDKTYLSFNETYLTPYCTKYLNLSEPVAATFVRVARKSVEVPELQKAVEEGLSVTKAKSIVSVLTKENHEGWIEKAQTLPKEKLEKEVAKENPSPKKPERAKPTGESRTRLEFELNDEEMAMQKRAMDLVAAKLGKSPSLAEVQRVLLEEFLKHYDPVKKAERAQARQERSRERSESAKQKNTGASAVKNKANPDAVKQKKTTTPTKPKKSRSLPASVKHEVNLRDQGRCQAKMPDGTLCGETKWVDLHHVIPRSEGGADTPENLQTLCSAHHRMCHAHGAG